MQAKNKTQPLHDNVVDFIESQPKKRRPDCYQLIDFFKEVTGEKPVMWGKSMVGFGKYHYVYDSGREGDMFLTGFSPRKQALTIYVMAGFGNSDTMSRLGKFKTGKSCLYVKKLEDIEMDVLKELTEHSIAVINKKYPG